jgi:hypothetical protein
LVASDFYAAPQHDELVQIDRKALVDGLRADSELTIAFHPSGPMVLGGWQRSDLPGRTIDHAGPILPLVEVRAAAPDGTLLLDGF